MGGLGQEFHAPRAVGIERRAGQRVERIRRLANEAAVKRLWETLPDPSLLRAVNSHLPAREAARLLVEEAFGDGREGKRRWGRACLGLDPGTPCLPSSFPRKRESLWRRSVAVMIRKIIVTSSHF